MHRGLMGAALGGGGKSAVGVGPNSGGGGSTKGGVNL